MQGRVYSTRNTLQFFTIPIGYFLGRLLVDKVFEPFMLSIQPDGLLATLFGTGKGSGAAFLFSILGIVGGVNLPYLSKEYLYMAIRKIVNFFRMDSISR